MSSTLQLAVQLGATAIKQAHVTLPCETRTVDAGQSYYGGQGQEKQIIGKRVQTDTGLVSASGTDKKENRL